MAVKFEGKDRGNAMYNAVDLIVVSCAGALAVTIVRGSMSVMGLGLFAGALGLLLIRNLIQRSAFRNRMTPTEQELFRETRSLLSWRPPKNTETPA